VQKVKPFKLVMVTSALPGEGKSSIASNLASFLAMEDKRVLLVDANLPSPALDQHFQLDHRPQLPSPFRQTWAEIEKHLDGQMTDIANLYLLTAGGLPSNSTGWLESPGVNQLFEHFTKAPFDYIIFDAPPLLSVADTQVLASSVQAVVLVVDVAKTPRKVLLRAKRMLDRTRTMILGVVINKSGWPEQGQTHPYLSDGQPPPVDMATARSIPRTASAMIKPPDTPAVNDLVDPDITITVPRQRWVKDNKSDLVEP
jgi:capsular exopolysaccharide synthesis family protein